ncbi:SDR family oxidoreductase [Desertifilum sp. FACHB-1129]|uniref:Ketoreductase domain-containing protein n=2 Tax=Desertifilum tharense IPPAS B-1220 TaxID=1781255 RepID=A0A1E5QPA1_9CYAN|nr:MULTISPECIES: SDR family oxidoreductase [Desertifilum]MCD8489378.1 SDR family oxidoreductase [Desertifilum sp.]MDA0210307.1 SDR family NAD(P)-dependent oxidoreductase [Cyanobacteria bacterium FC1]NES94059.1 SDR family oxidoreductase [Desertifilum sp. SIO1I2]MBD2310253.1 SDR family oxidoreductase [Desertifilum sp. FACHB-1129]MBD2322629.1 SDR family oxidoreductase [Desertifilum sp. FACHB-866]
MDNTWLRGHVSIITGGSAGIGRATAEQLVQAGATVAIVGRDRDRLQQTADSLQATVRGCTVMTWAADIGQAADMTQMADQILARYGRIDSLIAAAGILRPSGGVVRTLQQMSVREWDEVVDTNLKGVFLSNRAVLPAMIRQGSGQIINISSTSGRRGYAFDAAYCASKFGTIGLSEALAEEVRDAGVRVQVLLPGAIATPIWQQNGPIPRPENLVSVEEVARLILYLVMLPPDTVCLETTIEPLRSQSRPSWMQAIRGSA